MEKLLAMAMNGFLRQLLNSALRLDKNGSGQEADKREMSEEDREKANRLEELAKQARSLQRMSRRIR